VSSNSRPQPPFLGDVRCSFCGKPGDEVASIVCGPTPEIAICDECVTLCVEIISEQRAGQPSG
jgi:ATP-dependent Clp protease ATP-binding subunit ClpX